MKEVILIGYSGHAYVVAEVLELNDFTIKGYLENGEKTLNPFNYKFLGSENDEAIINQCFLNNPSFFIAIGNNLLREKIHDTMTKKKFSTINAIHPRAIVSRQCEVENGILIAAGAILNPLARIKTGCIINTGCIIEHECIIGDFAHIAPGAVLLGNVQIGKRTFIGANATIKQGIRIGDDVIIGAGAVVLNDIADNAKVAGNPAIKFIK